MNKIAQLKKYINESNNIVFFGGAGVSTASGIKDFRSKDGLYNEHYPYPPETILSHSFLQQHPQEFFQFYRDKMNCLNASPNLCHQYLTKLEQKGSLKAIITQNIDGLHQKAGSKNVLELHGSIYQNYCIACHRTYPPQSIFHTNVLPICTCGNLIRPNIVLYEEPLEEEIITNAIKYISNCDLLIVAGTSLTVYPASSFLRYFQGKHLVIINKDETPINNSADLVIHDNLETVFSKIN